MSYVMKRSGLCWPANFKLDVEEKEHVKERRMGGREVTVEDTHNGRSAAGTMATIEIESHLYQTS